MYQKKGISMHSVAPVNGFDQYCVAFFDIEMQHLIGLENVLVVDCREVEL